MVMGTATFKTNVSNPFPVFSHVCNLGAGPSIKNAHVTPIFYFQNKIFIIQVVWSKVPNKKKHKILLLFPN